MDNFDTTISEFFTKLGLSETEILIYKALIENGVSTLLKLSKLTILPRTTLYRLVDGLIQKGICEEILEAHTRKIKAIEPQKLNFLIQKEKQKITELETSLPDIQKILQDKVSAVDNETAGVAFYRGLEGLKQMAWHELEAKEILSYYYLTLDDIFGKSFANLYRAERTKRGIIEREIISSDDPYLTQNNVEIIRRSPKHMFYDWRYLPEEKLKIDHQVTIYSNTTSFFDWNTKGEIFGVEIKSKTITNLQRQIFEILWGISQTPEELLNKRAIQ